MSLADDFPDEMAQFVSIQAVASTGLYGPIFGSAVTYACHVRQKIKRITDKNGDEATSSLQIYLDGWPSVGYDSKITYCGANPPIKLIAQEPDEKGGAYATIIYT